MIKRTITAPISAIKRLRIGTDGKGIRTLVGFYGCPLKCKYCINPQTWDKSLEPTLYSPSVLLNMVQKDNLYFLCSNGGITFGGGEPLLYPEFINSFIDLAPTSWNYVIETSLSVPFKNISLISNFISLFVVDIKTLDKFVYEQYTGGDLKQALINLQKLLFLVSNDNVVVRIPFIPGYTTYDRHQKDIEYLRTIGISKINSFEYKV